MKTTIRIAENILEQFVLFIVFLIEWTLDMAHFIFVLLLNAAIAVPLAMGVGYCLLRVLIWMGLPRFF